MTSGQSGVGATRLFGRVALAGCLLLLAATPPAAPQAADPGSSAATPGRTETRPPPTFRGSVDVVEVIVEVAVTDRRGTAILGLGREDFIVEEDGSRVEVVHVEPVYANRWPHSASIAAPLEERGELPRLGEPAPPARNFIVLLQHLLFESDTTTLGATSRKFGAVRELRRWIAYGLGAADCVAVLAYDSRLAPLLDFSSDREELELAVRRALMDRSGPPGWKSPASSCPEILPHLPAGRELRDRTTSITDGLALLAEAAGHVEGRKHLLLFSLGVGLREARRTAGIGAALSLSQTLNSNRVTAYTLDLTPPRVRHAQEGALQGLARRTGGRYFGRSVGFFVPLEAIDAQLDGSYRIAFRSRHGAGSTGYRSIDVRTTEPSFRVSSRRGYEVREPAGGTGPGGGAER